MRGQVAFGSDGRGPGALRDQCDLPEVVARPEPALLLTVHRDLGVAVLDHEEADAALALAGDLLARGELPALHRLRDLVELLVVQIGEERDVLEELGGALVGHAGEILSRLRGTHCFHPAGELLDLALRRVELVGAEAVELLASLPERDRLVQVGLPALELLDDPFQLALSLLEGHLVALIGASSRRAGLASAAAFARWRHGALRARIAHTVPSGPAPPANDQNPQVTGSPQRWRRSHPGRARRPPACRPRARPSHGRSP